MRRVSLGLLCALAGALALGLGPAFAVEQAKPPRQAWSFAGILGTYDRAAAQRGLQVYREVCAGCHAVKYLHYRDLAQLGYNEDEVKALAAQDTVADGPNDEGQMFERPGGPADWIRRPFANDKAARAANGGTFPVDLSTVVKARDGGADYVYAVLTGYAQPPAGLAMGEGQHYNPYFPGQVIAMPAPLNDNQVAYGDGTAASVPQMAKDVVTFLAWAAEPEMEARKAMGIKTILFLIVLAGLLYAAKRKAWAQVH